VIEIISSFSFRKINEIIAAINGTKLTITRAFATLVFCNARIKKILLAVIKTEFNKPNLPALKKKLKKIFSCINYYA
jgi:hypothetical protein